METQGENHRFDRRRLLTAGVSFGVTFPLVLGYNGLRARRAESARVIALGAGDDLSVLVTSGPARLLIATGTDTTDFGNAFASALPFGLRRIDVVLLAGRGKSAIVAAHATRAVHGRTFAVVDPALAIEDLDLAPQRRVDVVTDPRQYQLPKGITVTVETATDGERSAWTATVARGSTLVAVMPDDAASALLPPHEPVSALIATGDLSSDSIVATSPPAIVVNADAATDDAVREDAVARSNPEFVVLRIFRGEAKALEFVEGGLWLHSDARSISRPAASS